MEIDPDTCLFEVWTQENADCDHEQESASAVPNGPGSGAEPWTHIANICLRSELTTSWFGDECLFFKHERLDLDFDKRPELEHGT